jgi:hypothetical protein
MGCRVDRSLEDSKATGGASVSRAAFGP